MKKFNRRSFFNKTTATLGAVGVFGVSSIVKADETCSKAIDISGKDKDDKQLVSMMTNVFKYDDAAKVAKCSTSKPVGNCGNCQYYVASEGSDCGECKLFVAFKNKIVKKSYCCNSWVAKS